MMPDELYDIYRFVLEDQYELEQHDLIVFLREPGIETEPAVVYLQHFARKDNSGNVR